MQIIFLEVFNVKHSRLGVTGHQLTLRKFETICRRHAIVVETSAIQDATDLQSKMKNKKQHCEGFKRCLGLTIGTTYRRHTDLEFPRSLGRSVPYAEICQRWRGVVSFCSRTRKT